MAKFDAKQGNINLNEIKKRLGQWETERFSSFATLSSSGIRRCYDEKVESGYRQTFSLDVDRILHSLAYTRYIDKTQVFYLIDNDHITLRCRQRSHLLQRRGSTIKIRTYIWGILADFLLSALKANRPCGSSATLVTLLG